MLNRNEEIIKVAVKLLKKGLENMPHEYSEIDPMYTKIRDKDIASCDAILDELTAKEMM